MELPIMDETTQPFIPAHELAKIWGVNGAMGESPYESPIFRLIVGQNEISHQSVGENCWPTLTNKMTYFRLVHMNTYYVFNTTTPRLLQLSCTVL